MVGQTPSYSLQHCHGPTLFIRFPILYWDPVQKRTYPTVDAKIDRKMAFLLIGRMDADFSGTPSGTGTAPSAGANRTPRQENSG